MSSEEPNQEGGEEYRPPSHQLATWMVLGAAFLLVLSLFSVRLGQHPNSTRAWASRTLPPEPLPVLMVEPEMDMEYWPCMDCHADEPLNLEVRILEEEHEDRSAKLDHGKNWCTDCHDAENRDMLHLARGELVSFDETWKLCVQCHGSKLEDWRAGNHGKRTGHWHGAKEYRTCIACHDPHNVNPAFKPIDPKPRPLRPTEITVHGNQRQEVSHDEH